MSAAQLVAEDLGKDFRDGFLMRKKTALDSVSFALPPGEIHGFLGPNGAGKSTTVHILLGFLFPSRGRALLAGRSPMAPEARESVGFLPEVFAFDRFSTGRALLRRFDALSGRGIEGREQRVDAALKDVDLTSAAGKRVGAYSKGMTQRIGLAQALLGDPEILILDEPMSGMDPSTRLAVRDLLRGRRDRGKTTLFSTHILSDVEAVADRVLILTRGRVVADAPLASFGTGAEGSTVIFHDEHGERFDPFLGELGVAREPQPGSAAVHRLAVADPRVQDRILERLAGNGAHIVSVTPERPSLEAAFLRLTSAGDAAS
jgi:ABC-2 type transport system ATP-binding protein